MTEMPAVIEKHLSTAVDFVEALRPTAQPWAAAGSGFQHYVFRGQRDAGWGLKPAVFRPNVREDWKSHLPHDTGAVDFVFELGLLHLFVNAIDEQGLPIPGDSQGLRSRWFAAKPSAQQRELAGDRRSWPDEELLPLMVLAQHYGVPTRLLDWSNRGYVAAYFAASGAQQFAREACDCRKPLPERFAVWAFNVANADELGVELVHVPTAGNKNLTAQRGVLTLLRDANASGPEDRAGLDEHVNKVAQTRRQKLGADPLTKFTLPVAEARRCLDLLRLEGYDSGSLFPGFEGAAMRAKEVLLHHASLTRHR